MALKDAWDALRGKKNTTEIVTAEERVELSTASDAFPVIRLKEEQLSAYKKLPLSSLAVLGTAFSQLPEGARTIVETTTRRIATNETLFVGINPKGIHGFLRENAFGTVGNIMQVNDQGKQIIAGRMRFKAINDIPVNETVKTIMPIDPTLMVVAVALVSIEQKLDGIQKSVEEVLQFLKMEKQSRQRGNLNMLAEVLDDYKSNCQNEGYCASRVGEVLSIKTAALQDVDFYQNQISAELQKQKGLHGSKDSKNLLDAVMYQFAEYQLACHIYAFSSFLDVMLRRSFSKSEIERTIDKVFAQNKRYEVLYDGCHSQIAKYQRSTVEAQIIGGIGAVSKGLGKAIASVPIIKEGPVDEALVSAGESMGRINRNAVQRMVKVFEAFEDSRMMPFADNLREIGLLYNEENAMITDGVNLYLRKSV